MVWVLFVDFREWSRAAQTVFWGVGPSATGDRALSVPPFAGDSRDETSLFVTVCGSILMSRKYLDILA
jgi:hypothetical protein